jgi:hypothetical protein
MSTCQSNPIGPAPGLDDFNADITNAVLLPLLVEPKVIPDIEERWSRVRGTYRCFTGQSGQRDDFFEQKASHGCLKNPS